ncbi:MAG: SRPBCC family protein [Candidatus Promineifilaceae bacterium]|nr:SRPBCC family protein [Candidatus Promineifilaceae bacterium]
MIQIEEFVIIDRSVPAVFDYLCDFESYPDWIDTVKSAHKVPQGPLRVGSRYYEQVEFGLIKGQAVWDIVEYEPERLIEFYSHNRLRQERVTFIISAHEDATEVRLKDEIKFAVLLRPFEPVIAARWRRVRRQLLGQLKQILEDHPDPLTRDRDTVT